MEENQDFGFAEFSEALFGDTDYQTGGDEGTEVEPDETETTTQGDDTTQEGESATESGDSDGDESTPENGDDPSGEGSEADSKDSEQMFTLKVNKQEQQVSREEMIALAQKGLDYDRMKEQSAKHQQTAQALQARVDELSKDREALDILAMIAKATNIKLSDVAENLYVNFRKNAGASEDAARLELKNAKLDRELNAMKAQKEQPAQEQPDQNQVRFQQDVAEFSRTFPGVELTKDLVDKLAPDIRQGLSLAAAYRKMEKAQSDARIAELERQLSARKQNDKNRRFSPGSQKDNGGRKGDSDLEAFTKALFG